MTVKVGTWLGAALGLVVLAGLIALAAWSQPAPVEPYPPATAARGGTLPVVMAAAASATPAYLAATPVAVEAFTPTPSLSALAGATLRRGATPGAEAPAEATPTGGVVVIVRLVALAHANPFVLPPALRDAAGIEYPVSPETLAAARRALPRLVAEGQAEVRLAFPDYTGRPDGLALLLNPGSANPFAPAMDIMLPAVEGD